MIYAGVNTPLQVLSAPIAGAATAALPTVLLRTRDLDIGGDGYIAGTVAVDSTPDYPVWRRVRLLNKRDGRIVRETWSDPVTGAYRFEYISRALEFIVIAHDHTGVYNAEVRDSITPKVMP